LWGKTTAGTFDLSFHMTKYLQMKKLFSATLAILALQGSQLTTYAQGKADALKIGVGGSFAKPKIMPRLEKLGIAQITVNYKLTTMERAVGKDRASGQMAGAKLSAYLETTDGDLTPADFQEITDHFYYYFQKSLKANGIDTVAWSAITATDFYKNADDKKEDNEEEKGSGQVWVTHNAFNGNAMYRGKTAFAFGKIKKASNFCGDIDAPAGFFHLTLDFADVAVNVDIKSKEHEGWMVYEKTTTYKYSAATRPVMKVTPSDMGNTMLWNDKSQSESIIVDKDIEAKDVYHTAASRDASRLKNNLFGFAKQMDPVVIETTRAQYKAAAKHALEGYADAFIAKAKELKKD